MLYLVHSPLKYQHKFHRPGPRPLHHIQPQSFEHGAEPVEPNTQEAVNLHLDVFVYPRTVPGGEPVVAAVLADKRLNVVSSSLEDVVKFDRVDKWAESAEVEGEFVGVGDGEGVGAMGRNVSVELVFGRGVRGNTLEVRG